MKQTLQLAQSQHLIFDGIHYHVGKREETSTGLSVLPRLGQQVYWYHSLSPVFIRLTHWNHIPVVFLSIAFQGIHAWAGDQHFPWDTPVVCLSQDRVKYRTLVLLHLKQVLYHIGIVFYVNGIEIIYENVTEMSLYSCKLIR